jgi:hypothetical protein
LAWLVPAATLRDGREVRDFGTLGFARDVRVSADANRLMRGKGA